MYTKVAKLREFIDKVRFQILTWNSLSDWLIVPIGQGQNDRRFNFSISPVGQPGHRGQLVQNHVAIRSNIEHASVKSMIPMKIA